MKPSLRLLYAEDNPQDADLTRVCFADCAPEFELRVVTSGAACLEQIRLSPPDLLLLDHRLSDTESETLLPQVLRQAPGLPVVIVTGGGDEALVVRLLCMGAAHYVPKRDNYLETLPDLLHNVVAEHHGKPGQGLPACNAPQRILYLEHLAMDIDLTLLHFAETAPHFTVEVAHTCAEALARLALPQPYDLLLIHLRMPDGSGLAFFREARQRFPHLPPCILISGSGDEMTALAALRLGAADYIIKREGYLTRMAVRMTNAIANAQLSTLNARLIVELAKRTEAESVIQRHCAELEEQVARGVAERTRELREAREYAENIVETVRESLVVLDANLKILTANGSFYDTFRVTPAETIGNFIYDLGNRQWDIPPLRRLLEDILPQETLFNGYEVEHEFPGIGRKTFLLNARQIHRAKIGAHIILLAMEDITQRKVFQEELLIKDQALIRSEKMASIGQLTAGVAHEINNPLGFIFSNLRTLADYFDQIARFDRFRRDLDAGEPGLANRDAIAARRVELEIDAILEDGDDLISGTLGGAKRVTKIVQDLKNYTRLDALEKEATTLDRCLESALAICNTQLKYVATVRKEYAATPKVLCNQGQLSQVFLNLLVNAGQAITAPGEILLKSRFDEQFIYVTVEDTGVGIPEEIMNRIFDPFFTTKEVGKGTGLGLSISAEIVKKHGGELLVESTVGVGTTFTVKLPRTKETTC